jgi:hypothetical protein
MLCCRECAGLSSWRMLCRRVHWRMLCRRCCWLPLSMGGCFATMASSLV